MQKNSSFFSNLIGVNTLVIFLVMLSRFTISGAFTAIYVLTAELFSSDVRNAAISILNSTGKLISLLSPFIAQLVSCCDHEVK